MAEIVVFRHAQGLTAGIVAFADTLRRGGHTVHTPGLFEGRTAAASQATTPPGGEKWGRRRMGKIPRIGKKTTWEWRLREPRFPIGAIRVWL